MYDSNNVHILVYVVIGLIGLIVGKFVAWMNMRLPEEKKVFSREFFKANKEGLEKNYICMIIMCILYVGLLKKFGLGSTFITNMDLIKYMVLMPMLVSSFLIDLKYRILPNRLNMTIFEFGLIFTFLSGIQNINLAQDMLLGSVAGAGIFGLITVLGGIIAGKEAMGLRRCKIYGSNWFVFWCKQYCSNFIISFFCGSYCFCNSSYCS